MISKEKLFKNPNYLLSKYQAELFRELTTFMEANDLTQKQVAKMLGVSTSYINQILKGNFNFTLKKLIELSLMMGKVPSLEFISITEFWKNQQEKSSNKLVVQGTIEATAVMYVKIPQPAQNLSSEGHLELEVESTWVLQSLN